MKFPVAITWSMSGTFDVEADSLEEAIAKVEEGKPPYDGLPDGEYIDDSMRIDEDQTDINMEYMNEE